MKTTTITRREILSLLAGLTIASLPRLGFSDAAQSERILNVLAGFARRLFPHRALDGQVYLDVLKPLQAESTANPRFAATLRVGCDVLDSFAGGDWMGADLETQIAAMRSIESSAFFERVRDQIRVELYYHPKVWELLGFEGSSVQYGGYIDRGFDDIDWLPKL